MRSMMCHNGLFWGMFLGRGSKYKIRKGNDVVLRKEESANSATSDANSATSDTNSATSNANSATSDANSATSNANSATSDANSATSPKKRMKKEELYGFVVDICEDWVSLEEIVQKTGRSHPYLRNTVIPGMIAGNLIEMVYPGTPNLPKQKYKKKD